MIANFEDQSGICNANCLNLTGAWLTYNDGTGTQVPPVGSMPSALVSPGGSVDAYALQTSGQGFSTWGAGVGVNFTSTTASKNGCTYDATWATGVSFYIRGTGAGLIRFMVPTAQTLTPSEGGACLATGTGVGQKCDDHYGMDVSVSGAWTAVAVPFASLSQNHWGIATLFDKTQIIGLRFQVNFNVSFDVWIDNVAFY
jgi:hypothetical protein